MGKIADSVKKVVKDVIVKPIKEVIDAPIRVVYDTLVKGKSFQDSLKKETADIIKAFGNASRTIYSEILKPLGVDDENFFGIGGWLGDKLGTLVKDVTYDDAYQSVGIAAIVAVTILTWGYGSSFALSAANYMTVAAYGAGVSSSFALMATWYATQIVVYFGMSALLSGIIDAAVFVMLGGVAVFDLINRYNMIEEQKRVSYVSSIHDGSIFDNMAGGIVYNDIFAGGTFFDATQAPNTSCSVGELPQFGQNLIRLEFPFSNYAGEYDKNLAGDSNYSVLRYKIPQ
jgi:hypothetical protein